MTELWLWEMQPGEKFESAGHPVGTLELLYVQAGTLTLGIRDGVFMVNTGCAATARQNRWSAFLRKPGREPPEFHHDL